MPRANQRPRLNTRPGGVPKSTRQYRMAKAVKKGPTHGAIKVQLDHRTVITLASESSLAFWRVRYPNLRVINS